MEIASSFQPSSKCSKCCAETSSRSNGIMRISSMKHRSHYKLMFGTLPSLNDGLFRKACADFRKKHDDFDDDSIRIDFGQDIDYYDLILDYLFEYKYMEDIPHVTNFEAPDSDYYRFVWKNPYIESAWNECVKESDGYPSNAFKLLLEDQYVSMLDAWGYNAKP